jgi:molybdopterin-containing oxidoreductase family membrane subunit
MTLFAVACAGMFPLLHLGRPWLFYWLIPYPNTMGVWPQFRSPLIWDVFAVGTYATVSLIFWYVGLIPDLASMRDKAKRRLPQIAYGFLALGWRGSARHWKRYQTAYLLLAGLATPLVVSVHTVVSYDFAVSLLPGWHNTLYPPYFVAGAVFSGFSMVLTIAIPLRRAVGLHDFITTRHLDMMAKVMLATGLIVAYGYLMEVFGGFYSANKFEAYVVTNRAFGPYAPAFWLQILCNVLIPQLLWIRWFRTKPLPLFIVAIFINIGMWVERYVIVITSLHRDFMPSSWGMFHGTFWDWSLLLGSVGLFAALLFLFVRFLPMISIYEMRELVHEHSGPNRDENGDANKGEASSSK